MTDGKRKWFQYNIKGRTNSAFERLFPILFSGNLKKSARWTRSFPKGLAVFLLCNGPHPHPYVIIPIPTIIILIIITAGGGSGGNNFPALRCPHSNHPQPSTTQQLRLAIIAIISSSYCHHHPQHTATPNQFCHSSSQVLVSTPACWTWANPCLRRDDKSSKTFKDIWRHSFGSKKQCGSKNVFQSLEFTWHEYKLLPDWKISDNMPTNNFSIEENPLKICSFWFSVFWDFRCFDDDWTFQLWSAHCL